MNRSVLVLFFVLVCSSDAVLSQGYDILSVIKGTFVDVNGARGCQVRDMVTDASGNIYITGQAHGAFATAGAYKTTFAGENDAFVCKVSADLSTLFWFTYFGSGGDDIGNRIVLTSQNEPVIIGLFQNINGIPATDSSDLSMFVNPPTINGEGLFVAKFSSNGSQLLFSRITPRVDGVWLDSRRAALTINANNDIYCAFWTDWWYWPLANNNNAYQRTYGGGSGDICLIKYSGTGSLLYASYIGGQGDDIPQDIAVENGKVYIGGTTNSANYPLASGKTPDQGDMFIMVWNDAAIPTPVISYIYGGQLIDDMTRFVYHQPTQRFLICGQTNGGLQYTNLLTPGQVSGAFAMSIKTDFSVVDWLTIVGTDVRPVSMSVLPSGETYVGCTRLLRTCSVPISPGAYKPLQTVDYEHVIIGLTNTGAFRYGSNAYSGRFTIPCLLVKSIGTCVRRILCVEGPVPASFPTTGGTYQVSPIGTGAGIGICYYQTAHKDTAAVSAGSTCGEYVFTAATTGQGQCAATAVLFNYGDGTPWQTGTPATHTYTKNGTYVVRMRVAYPGGDTTSWTTTLVVQSQPVVRALSSVLYRCAKDSGLTLMATGAVRYEWRPKVGLSDSTSFTPRARPTQNTKYYVRGYDANGCYAEDSVQVFVTSVNAIVTTLDTAVCAGGSVVLKASGASFISWSPPAGLSTTKGGNVTATPALTTEYRVIISDGSCADTARVKVRIAHAPKLELSPAAVVCTGGSAMLSAAATSADSVDTVGVRYAWKPASTLNNASIATPIATPTKTTRYVCTVTNRFGCVKSDSVEVKVQPSLDLRLSSDTATCTGSTLILKASGGAMYSWTPKEGLDDSTKAMPRCTPARDINYTVITWSGDYATATCRDTAYMRVRVVEFPKVHATGASVVCPNSTVALHARIDSSAVSGLVPQWELESGTIVGRGDSIAVVVDSTTRYTVRIANAQGCTSLDTVTVVVSSTLRVHAQPCAAVKPGDVVRLTVENPQRDVSYTWYKSTGEIIAQSDTCSSEIRERSCFIVHGKRGGCEGWDTVCVDVNPQVRVQACQAIDVCRGSNVTLYVVNTQPDTRYSWSRSGGSLLADGDTVRTTADTSSWYYVEAFGATSTGRDSVRVTVYALPEITVSDTIVCEGMPVRITAYDTSSQDMVEWFDASGRIVSSTRTLDVASAVSSRYTARATTANKCTSTATMTLGVTPKTSLTLRVQAADSVWPGTHAEVRVLAESDRLLVNTRLRARLTMPKDMMVADEGLVMGDSIIVNIDTVMNIGTTPVIASVVHGMALITPHNVVTINVNTIETGLDEICTKTVSSPWIMVVRPICGNDYLRLEMSEPMLTLAPNPSDGDVIIHSSEEVIVADAMGREVPVESEHSNEPGDGLITRAHKLATGVYVVRLKYTGAKAARFVVSR